MTEKKGPVRANGPSPGMLSLTDRNPEYIATARARQASLAALRLSARYGFPIETAFLVAELAGLGGARV